MANGESEAWVLNSKEENQMLMSSMGRKVSKAIIWSKSTTGIWEKRTNEEVIRWNQNKFCRNSKTKVVRTYGERGRRTNKKRMLTTRIIKKNREGVEEKVVSEHQRGYGEFK